MQKGYPSLDEIHDRVDDFVASNGRIARLIPTAPSEEGRRVPAVAITDPRTPDDDKEVALVVCGRHGNELGTRTVGLEMLGFLAGEAAALIRGRLNVVVVPVANPDGCVRAQFHAPSDGLSPTEIAALVPLAHSLQPDAVVDIHSLGQSDIEAVITANTSPGGIDDRVHNALAERMCEAACREGFCFTVESVAGGGYNNFFAGWCYDEFHSTVFGMEVNHAALSPGQAGASGRAAVVGLLVEGTKTFTGERYPGFPNRVVAGDEGFAVRASGETAAARRASRASLWRAARGRGSVKRRFEDGVVVCSAAVPVDEPLEAALSCRVRVAARRIAGVTLSGSEVKWEAVERPCQTDVFVDTALEGDGIVEMRITLSNSK
ncbi:MAG: hypothetical protein J7M19_00305 [Planctomycetes bacterium]|nr:hypothetical protein [Planctomycetota bacterium]